MERALQIVVELLRLVVAAAIVLIGFVIFLSSPFHHPNSVCKYGCPPVANLRTINTAEVTYLSSLAGHYGKMEDLIAARLLDDTFTGTKAGYRYTVTLDATSSGYTAEAVPVSSTTGRYSYYSVPDAIVRYGTLAPTPEQTGRSVQ